MTERAPPKLGSLAGRAVEIGRRDFTKRGLVLGAGLLGAPSLVGSDAPPASAAIEEETHSRVGNAEEAEQRGDDQAERGAAVLEDRFDLEVEGRAVPGILWRPPDANTRTPLVLAGHGGAGFRGQRSRPSGSRIVV